MKNERIRTSGSSSRRKLLIPAIGVILLVFGGGLYWYINYSRYISTDDAHIEGNMVSLSSKMLGRISRIYVDEGDTVYGGQLLVQLDTSDIIAQQNQLKAVRFQTITQKEQAEAKYHLDQESIVLLRINMEKTQGDYERAKKQFEGNVISAEQFEHTQKANEAAIAQYDASKAQLDLSRSQIGSALAGIKSAEAQIGVVVSQLNNTRLLAPGKAVVARRWLLNGDVTQPGQSVLSLTLNDHPWVAVFLEETSLAYLYNGQRAKFALDAYPGITFFGHVFYIGSSTAGQFSLIPPSNASGNFTKITQRILVKISIDKADDGSLLEKFRLLPGMSAVVKIMKK
jgi:membrane fusion protein (multidrug efflux system)